VLQCCNKLKSSFAKVGAFSTEQNFIVSFAKSCSIDADDVWEQTQINISKETLERGMRANKSSEDQCK
jgi:hypothetical protein